MIDAHQHVWQLGRNGCAWPTGVEAPIFRDYGLADFRQVAAPGGVMRTVLVQSQENAVDTDWLLDLADGERTVAGVVGWVDFTAPDAPTRIAAIASRPKLKALRPMVQDKAADWYDDVALEPAFRAMVERGLRLDALVRVPHLPSLDRLAGNMPDLPIVIDHAAKPGIGADGGFAEWHSAIAPLSERTHVFCKLSGLLTECAGAPAAAVEPYIAAILDLFGPGRVMWGSDWPVLELASSSAGWLDLARACVPAWAQSEVFAGTAARFYDIGEA